MTTQALKTNDIFRTVRLMKANSDQGGFDFMEPPGAGYYRDVLSRIPSLTPDQLDQLEVSDRGTMAATDMMHWSSSASCVFA